MLKRTHLSLLAVASICLAIIACESGDVSPTSIGETGIALVVLPGGGVPDGDGVAQFEEFELCKFGTTTTFDYSVTDLSSSTTTTGQVTLDDGDCVVLALFGGVGGNVTVTEQEPAGWDLDHVDVTTVNTSGSSTATVPGPTVSGTISGSSGSNGLQGILAEFYNVPEPPILVGRMTGGGSFFDNGTRFTHGFELHCDPNHLPNNLQINWRGSSNSFHLATLTSVVCTDDPALDPLPRPAPFDTYVGTGVGSLNGVPGATISFTFTDDGEGGSADLADVSIVPPGGGTPIVASSTLRSGNHQAHPDN